MMKNASKFDDEVMKMLEIGLKMAKKGYFDDKKPDNRVSDLFYLNV